MLADDIIRNLSSFLSEECCQEEELYKGQRGGFNG